MANSDWEHNPSQNLDEDFGEGLFEALSDIEPTDIETLPEVSLNQTHTDEPLPPLPHHQTVRDANTNFNEAETAPTLVEELPAQKSRTGPALLAIILGLMVIAGGYLAISEFGGKNAAGNQTAHKSGEQWAEEDEETGESVEKIPSSQPLIKEDIAPEPKPFEPPPSPFPNYEPPPSEPMPAPNKTPKTKIGNEPKPSVTDQKDIEPKTETQPNKPRPKVATPTKDPKRKPPPSEPKPSPPPPKTSTPEKPKSAAPSDSRYVVRYRCPETLKKFYVDRTEMLKDAARLKKLDVGVYTAKTRVKKQVGTTLYYQTVFYMTYRLRAGGSATFANREEADRCAAFLRGFGFMVSEE